MLSHINETAEWLQSQLPRVPQVAIILGSGLGKLAESVEDATTISYHDIPHFPVSTVEGHAGNLICGRLGGKDVLLMSGRFHYYEGYSMQ